MRWCGDWEGYRSPVKAGDYCLVSPDRGLYTDDAFDGETLYMVSVGEVRYQGVGTYVNHLTRIGGRSNINPPGFTPIIQCMLGTSMLTSLYGATS